MARALGDSVLQLNDDLPLGVGFHVYRMPAGMTTRPHRHNGHEQFLILEGELIENDGTVLKAGDLVWFRDGTSIAPIPPTAACSRCISPGSNAGRLSGERGMIRRCGGR